MNSFLCKPAATKTNKKMNKGIDRISGLPQPITHHIMSFLPTRDVARTSILSKPFNSIWRSFPIFDFNQTLMFDDKLSGQYYYSSKPNSISNFIRILTLHRNLLNQYRSESEYDEEAEESSKKSSEKYNLFLDYVVETVERSNLCGTTIPKFNLYAYFDYSTDKCDHRIERAIAFACRNKVKELEYGTCLNDVSIDAYYYLPEALCGNSLTCLKLYGVVLNLEGLLLSCPSLENLSLRMCNLRDGVKVCGGKLKCIEILICGGVDSVEIRCNGLQSFAFTGYGKPCKIDITDCRNIRSLSLNTASIADDWLNKQLQIMRDLECLNLKMCSYLRKVVVKHEELRSFTLLSCNKVVEISIDAPKLVSFTYGGCVVYCALMNSPRLRHASLSLFPTSEIIPPVWFAALRELLSFFGHCKALTLHFRSCMDASIPEELRDTLLPPLYDLKVLKVKIDKLSKVGPDLLDGLLWLSPHLETLLFLIESKEKSIKFQYDELEADEEDDTLCCCFSKLSKCWRHSAKQVYLENFDNPYERESLLKFFNENQKCVATST